MNGTVATARNSETQKGSEGATRNSFTKINQPITIKQMTRNNSVSNNLRKRRESRLI